MKIAFFFSLFLSLTITLPLAAQHDADNPPMEGFNSEASDARAIEIADHVMRSLGGRTNWDQTRYLTWTFVNGDDHVWDKWTGWSRWQRDSIVVLMNINSMEGQAWIHGQEITTDAQQQNLLISAHRNWANSSYWLLMPFKLKDTGVTLRYGGEEEMEDGQVNEILFLSFENVGYTPDNGYKVYVDQETMLVSSWAYYQNVSDEEPRLVRPWQNWQQYGNIMLSDLRGVTDNGDPWGFTNVGVYAELPETVFQDPVWLDMTTLDGS